MFNNCNPAKELDFVRTGFCCLCHFVLIVVAVVAVCPIIDIALRWGEPFRGYLSVYLHHFDIYHILLGLGIGNLRTDLQFCCFLKVKVSLPFKQPWSRLRHINLSGEMALLVNTVAHFCLYIYVIKQTSGVSAGCLQGHGTEVAGTVSLLSEDSHLRCISLESLGVMMVTHRVRGTG